MGNKKKVKRYHKPGYKKVLRTIAGLASDLLISGPVSYPAFMAGSELVAGKSPKEAMNTFTRESVGFDMTTGKVDNAKLGQIILRDMFMVGGGALLRWSKKKIG